MGFELKIPDEPTSITSIVECHFRVLNMAKNKPFPENSPRVGWFHYRFQRVGTTFAPRGALDHIPSGVVRSLDLDKECIQCSVSDVASVSNVLRMQLI